MKIYIFLALSIFGMGGGQTYLYRKRVWLEKQGYNVLIFSALEANDIEDDLFVKGLGDSIPDVYKELNEYPSCLRKSDRDKVLNSILSRINSLGKNDSCIVESDNIATAQWGELISRKIQAKHFMYFLQENIEETFCKDSLEFLLFKNSRRELAGIVRNSFDVLFEKYNVLGEKPIVLAAYGADDCLMDCDYDWLKERMGQNVYRIATIGRINKLYVKPMTNKLVEFFAKHPEQMFEIIYIGGGAKNKIEENEDVIYIRELFSMLKNVNVIITGSVFPIPEGFISECDMFIGSSGGAIIPYRKNKLSVALDGHDGKPIGVMGYTTSIKNALYRSDEMNIIELDELLEKILYSDYLQQYEYIPYDNSEFDYESRLFEHLEVIQASSETKEYFGVERIKYKYGKDLFEKKVYLKKLLMKLLGVNMYYKMKRKTSRTLKKAHING